MSYALTALACGIIGSVLLYLGIKARRSEVGVEGKVIMPLAGVMFLLAAVGNAVVSVVTLVL